MCHLVHLTGCCKNLDKKIELFVRQVAKPYLAYFSVAESEAVVQKMYSM